MAERESRGRVIRQDRAIRTRKMILEAAGSSFDDHGYSGATIADMCERAGITKGALYFHFPNKESLAVAVMDAQFDDFTIPPRELALQELVDAGYLLCYQYKISSIQRGAARIVMDEGSDRLGRKDSMQMWTDVVTGMLTEARKRGELLESVGIPDVGWLINAAFAGVQNMSQAFDGRATLPHWLTVMWEHTLPTIAVPSALGKLKIGPERAKVVAEEYEALRLDGDEQGSRLPAEDFQASGQPGASAV